MDLYWWSSWVSMFVQPLWAMPRFGREALLRIVLEQPLEFRIKILTWQVRQIYQPTLFC